MNMGISVYVRAAAGGKTIRLCQVAGADEAEGLLTHIRLTGIYANGSVSKDVEAQYVLEDSDVYYEIIVG